MALRYYRSGKFHQGESLFGSPRGNPVMKAKRVSGESAQTTLKRHVMLERCSVKGCSEPVMVTRNRTGVAPGKRRFCEGHLAGKQAQGKSADIKSLLALPWEG